MKELVQEQIRQWLIELYQERTEFADKDPSPVTREHARSLALAYLNLSLAGDAPLHTDRLTPLALALLEKSLGDSICTTRQHKVETHNRVLLEYYQFYMEHLQELRCKVQDAYSDVVAAQEAAEDEDAWTP